MFFRAWISPPGDFGEGAAGRLFALVVLVAPLGLLFHRPFVVEVVLPFMQAVGAME
jgi:hypothetical protein